MHYTNNEENKLDINLTLDINNLVNTSNSISRIPICLVLDTSGSMSGEPIRELNRGVNVFFEAVRQDEIARYSAEIAIVTFGGDISKALDFCSIEAQDVPVLNAYGNTPMGQAVDMGLSLLDARKRQYSSAGIEYYQPWIVLMTDGTPTDDISLAAAKTTQMVNNRKLAIFPIGIGQYADLTTLAAFSPKNKPASLNGVNFTVFFEWLSKSIISVPRSTPGDHIDLPAVNWTI